MSILDLWDIMGIRKHIEGLEKVFNMEKQTKNKPKISKEQLKYKEWEKYNKEYDNKGSKNSSNLMYDGEVKGKRWGW